MTATCRYIAALTGEEDLADNPLSEPNPSLVPLIATAQSSDSINGLTWTQSGDGLLSADSAGTVTMWGMPEEGMPMPMLWRSQLEALQGQPPVMLNAGLDAESPAAVAAYSSKQVNGMSTIMQHACLPKDVNVPGIRLACRCKFCLHECGCRWRSCN